MLHWVYATLYKSNPHPTDSRVNKGLQLCPREETPFGSVTRNHYAAEHFLTRYSALIICLASAPETYGFIAKYARATNSARRKNLISTSCSVLRSPKFRGTNGCVRKTRDRSAAAPVNLFRRRYNLQLISDGPRHRKRGTRANERCFSFKKTPVYTRFTFFFIVLTAVNIPFETCTKYRTQITLETRYQDQRLTRYNE